MVISDVCGILTSVVPYTLACRGRHSVWHRRGRNFTVTIHSTMRVSDSSKKGGTGKAVEDIRCRESERVRRGLVAAHNVDRKNARTRDLGSTKTHLENKERSHLGEDEPGP